jgi:hypothetical protein
MGEVFRVFTGETMLNGTIKAISQGKFVILWNQEGNSDERWFKITPEALKYAKKGQAAIEMDPANLVTKVMMVQPVSNGNTAPTPSFPVENQNISSNKDQSIARAVALKACVDLACHGKIEQADILKVGETFEKWLTRSESSTV